MKIVVCGSMAFAKEMVEAREKLEKLGHEAFLPEAFGKFISGEWQVGNPQLAVERKIQHDFIKKHYSQITKGDAILVLNYDKKRDQGLYWW